ncbi:benzoylformate decarboxylase [Corynebacterium sp. YIM 101645]|uniref:acetolactate synthase n=1 Tax=Corynebacterium lemuris TaxID=1859292 RepID=A0ABT2G3N4_9CORY|nr:benzoylformate decarboxylase [Corynebacterium lemuris]MCS5480799.1 benzoylformate decarboxylase [Corynebacterium lemuris]
MKTQEHTAEAPTKIESTRTVRSLVHDLMLKHGMFRIFGNPGSNELPFLSDLPKEIEYVLGLHEQVVVGMADGFAQASGEPAFVNLHAASGTGNAMGALTNAFYSRTPLVVTAGQQVRETIGMHSFLSNVDAAQLTKPLTKWSCEPASASDVPRSFNEAVVQAQASAPGPVYLSIPYDDWDHEASPNDELLLRRSYSEEQELSASAVGRLAETIAGAGRIALILGSAVDTVGANESAVALAENTGADVYLAPSPYRLPFPNKHGQFRGVLPASIHGVNTALAPYDLVLVIGAPVFRYHQYEPDQYLDTDIEFIHITDDADEAARAPFGTAIVTGIRRAVELLAEAVEPKEGLAPLARQDFPDTEAPVDGIFDPARVFSLLRENAPADTAYVVESTSTNSAFWSQMDLQDPSSYFWPASGGLGFGMPATVGVQMGLPDRQVIGIIGDGSANYGITALWTAAQYDIPVVFIVLKNGTYGALRWFSDLLGTPDAPGMDVPDIDFLSLARGYGVTASTVDSDDSFRETLAAAIDSRKPHLIEINTSLTQP